MPPFRFKAFDWSPPAPPRPSSETSAGPLRLSPDTSPISESEQRETVLHSPRTTDDLDTASRVYTVVPLHEREHGHTAQYCPEVTRLRIAAQREKVNTIAAGSQRLHGSESLHLPGMRTQMHPTLSRMPDFDTGRTQYPLKVVIDAELKEHRAWDDEIAATLARTCQHSLRGGVCSRGAACPYLHICASWGPQCAKVCT